MQRLRIHPALPVLLYTPLHGALSLLVLSPQPHGIEDVVCKDFSVLCREVNPIFEGNQQHDAHELLVCLLDNIRETCRFLADQQKLASEQHVVTNSVLSCDLMDVTVNLHQATSSNSGKWGVRKSWKRKKGSSSSSQKNAANNGLPNGIGPEHPHLMNGGVGTHQSLTGDGIFLFQHLN